MADLPDFLEGAVDLHVHSARMSMSGDLVISNWRARRPGPAWARF